MSTGVIFTLIAIVVVVLILVATTRARNKNGENSSKPIEPATINTVASSVTTNQAIDAKVLAAITAAIVAVTGTPAANLKFTAIKRLGSDQLLPWAYASNLERMNMRKRFS